MKSKKGVKGLAEAPGWIDWDDAARHIQRRPTWPDGYLKVLFRQLHERFPAHDEDTRSDAELATLLGLDVKYVKRARKSEQKHARKQKPTDLDVTAGMIFEVEVEE